MVKQGFLRTLEVVIAIAITFIFLTVFIPTNNLAKVRLQNLDLLSTFDNDEPFRYCVLTENVSCVNSTLSPYLQLYDYTFNISASVNAHTSLPEKRIMAESAFIAGNSSLYSPRIIRLYYWSRT